MMDCEDNTSSLSSSDWEDASNQEGEGGGLGGGHHAAALQAADEAGVHADDEQSDWPGAADDDDTVSVPGGSLSFGLDDDNAGGEDLSSDSLSAFFATGGEPSSMLPMTATARTTYLARMKRLAECVPGREIRAGARKLLHNRSAFTIKSSSSEQLSRFLQDSSRTELRLTVTRPADWSKVVQMANLYSLSVRLEPASPNLLVLSKTVKTVRVTKEFVGAGVGGGGGAGIGMGGAAASRIGGGGFAGGGGAGAGRPRWWSSSGGGGRR